MTKANNAKKVAGKNNQNNRAKNGNNNANNKPRVVKSASVQIQKTVVRPGSAVRSVQSTKKVQQKLQQKVQQKTQQANRQRTAVKSKLVLLDPPRSKNPAPTKAPSLKKNAQGNNKANNRANTNTRPVSAPRQKQQIPALTAQPRSRVGGASEITLALQTANSIAINRAHPKQADVVELLRTREKGWIDDHKFMQVLKGLVF
mmetsp:Transcript_37019/g.73672  ORF Transcript_37019/g.73672 Transcript_37019/m.73672 type:complete len:202 (+) Transcript_37019:108-713(+)